MSYAGFYINLDRCTDRKAEMETELARCGLQDSYRRFPAANGNALNLSNPHITPGEMGCFTSHYLLLKQNLGSAQHLHIIEDDVIFSQTAKSVIETVTTDTGFGACDIIYTDIFVPVLGAAYKAYKKFFDATATRGPDGKIKVSSYGVVPLKGLPFASTSSYLVNKNSIEKLHGFYERQINAEPRNSNDLFIRALNEAGLIKVGCVFPFVTSIRLDHIAGTDIEHTYSSASALAAHLGRYSFFVDADFDLCQSYLDKFLSLPAQTSPHTRLLNHLLNFSLTENYHDF